HRGQLPMILLNFPPSHPLTPEQLQRIEGLTGQQVERVMEVSTQLDHEQPFAEQVRGLVTDRGIDAGAL
ncbi:MAG: CRISPR-associated protein Csx15, partial [Dehalococcoidia bacterium]